MARTWHLKLGGKPLYLAPAGDGGHDVYFATDESEPGTTGQIGTIIIPSLHHGLGPVKTRDPMTIWTPGNMDLSVPGTVLRAGGLTNILANTTDKNWYDSQGGGMIVYPHLNVLSDQRLMAVTAKRIYRVDPGTPAATEVYALDDTKYAFTGSACLFRGSIYFGVESNIDQTARGYYGAPMVRYNITENAFTLIGYKGSIVQTAKGGIWWVDNRGLSDAPQAYWTDHENWPASPTPGSLTKEIIAGSDDGYIYKYGPDYLSLSSTTVDATATLFRVGQAYSIPTYYRYRGYLRFDTSNIPINAMIISVKMRVNLLSKSVGGAEFNMQVRKYTWGPTLEAADWRATPANDPLLGSSASSGWTAPQVVEIALDPSQALTLGATAYSEFYLISDRDVSNIAPTADEYANFEAFENAGTTEAELIVEYTVPVSIAIAGPFPIEPGGYCTAGGGLLGPWVVWFKQDGQVYGIDGDGTLAPIIPQGMTKADIRFARGNCVFNQQLIIPHLNGCLSLDMSTLSVADIHPAKAAEAIIYTTIPQKATAALWFGARLLIALGGYSGFPALMAYDTHPDGSYATYQGESSGLTGYHTSAMAALLTSTGSVRLFVLNWHPTYDNRTRIEYIDLPGTSWSVRPTSVRTGTVYTPFNSGGDELSLVTKRFFRLRGYALDVDGTNKFTLSSYMDYGGGASSLGTVSTEGPFQLAFPTTSASLGRAVAIQIDSVGTTATKKSRLELPLFIDYEYVPAANDRLRLGIEAGRQQITPRGDVIIRDDALDVETFLVGLRGTITTLVWPTGATWNVLVEKIARQVSEAQDTLHGQTQKINVWIRRL